MMWATEWFCEGEGGGRYKKGDLSISGKYLSVPTHPWPRWVSSFFCSSLCFFFVINSSSFEWWEKKEWRNRPIVFPILQSARHRRKKNPSEMLNVSSTIIFSLSPWPFLPLQIIDWFAEEARGQHTWNPNSSSHQWFIPKKVSLRSKFIQVQHDISHSQVLSDPIRLICSLG